jgi:hypothetical protein
MVERILNQYKEIVDNVNLLKVDIEGNFFMKIKKLNNNTRFNRR